MQYFVQLLINNLPSVARSLYLLVINPRYFFLYRLPRDNSKIASAALFFSVAILISTVAMASQAPPQLDIWKVAVTLAMGGTLSVTLSAFTLYLSWLAFTNKLNFLKCFELSLFSSALFLLTTLVLYFIGEGILRISYPELSKDAIAYMRGENLRPSKIDPTLLNYVKLSVFAYYLAMVAWWMFVWKAFKIFTRVSWKKAATAFVFLLVLSEIQNVIENIFSVGMIDPVIFQQRTK